MTKALSVLQPWAWLITHGYKDVENRTWPTKVRGPLLIHAGKGFDREGYELVRRLFPGVPLPSPNAFARGGIVGSCVLLDCVQTCESPWFRGPWGFIVGHASVLPFRALRGQLGFFDVDENFQPTQPELEL